MPLSGLNTPATGNYSVIPVSPAPASTTGGDPWNSPVVFPAYEGASLVVAGTGTNTVSLYDKGLPGTFVGSTNYTLFVQPTTTSFTRFDNINADGQLGRSISPTISGKDLLLNGVSISGPGERDANSDYDGVTSGSPLPLLWDDAAHDVTGVPVVDPATSAVDLNVVVNGQAIAW